MFNKLDVKIIKAFLKYNPSVSGKDVIKKYSKVLKIGRV